LVRPGILLNFLCFFFFWFFPNTAWVFLLLILFENHVKFVRQFKIPSLPELHKPFKKLRNRRKQKKVPVSKLEVNALTHTRKNYLLHLKAKESYRNFPSPQKCNTYMYLRRQLFITYLSTVVTPLNVVFFGEKLN